MVRKVLKALLNIITVFFILIIVMSLYSMLQYRKKPENIPSVFGFSGMSVLSGSMRPYLEPGDMIVDRTVRAEDIKAGDIITFKDSGSIVSHRVTEIIAEGDRLLFETRGDANNVGDSKLVSEDQIIGKVLFKIPYGGYIARFVRSPAGLMIFIIIPIILMIVDELMKVILPGGKKKKCKKPKSEDSVNID